LPLALPAPALWAIFYYAAAVTVIAYLIYYQPIALSGAGNTMLVTLLIVPVAVILGALVRGEALTPNAYAGFGVIAIGLVLIDGRLFRPRN
ncbi:MAG TPA: EamA/RhaT family transporter, partial [Rhodobacterales bacterium]|nr:EamA/RhaT family transporter [Rhodobacterales bacterium]